jgi:hypothetical protein
MWEGFRRSVAGASAALALLAGGVTAQPAAAAKRPPECRGANILGGGSEQPIAELPGALEAPVLSSYGVFARPQGAADQLPPVNTAGISLEFRMSSYYPSEIRQLRVLPDNRRFLAVPGFQRTFKIPPAICLPKEVRKHRAQIVEEETRRASQPSYCVIEVGGRHRFGGGVGCTLFSEVAKSQSVFSAGPDSTTVIGLVPNGVSAVRVVYPRGPVVVAPVSENSYLLTVPAGILRAERKFLRQQGKLRIPHHPTKAQLHRLERAYSRIERRMAAATEPLRVEWLGAGGTVLKTIPRPHGDEAQIVSIV